MRETEHLCKIALEEEVLREIEYLCKIALEEEVYRINEFFRIKQDSEKELKEYQKEDRFSHHALNHHNNCAAQEKIKDCIAALARIEDGTFGICPDCQEKIADERLINWPYAKRCKSCQETNERENGFIAKRR